MKPKYTDQSVLRKLVIPALGAIKSIDTEKRKVTAYASTNDWDRYQERFEADAFKEGLDNYKKNPVVLFAHNYMEMPIGKTSAYDFDLKGLITETTFADHAMANDIFDLYRGGFMSAFSVGFRPLEVGYEEMVPGSGNMCAVFKKAELLENSAVPVPANPAALVKGGMLAIAQRAFAPAIEVPKEWAQFESWLKGAPADGGLSPEMVKLVNDGRAPAFGPTLEYLIALGKMLKAKGKIEDDSLRRLMIQSNNIFRELIYGPQAAKLEDLGDAPLTDGEIAAMMKEIEVLAAAVEANPDATEEDKKELAKIAELLEQTISGN